MQGLGQAEAMARLAAFVEATRRGDAEAALLAASDACHAAPNLPEAHYAYGQAWLAASNPARAEQAVGAAIALKPG